ncbi:non-ribosomal peptide synthetase [Vibrio spartinae]|uniref:Dimodular nonribosomal peptide synthase n=1 Tax=Vibrio spartinae TaxID=1918945 RepID=A0A1N6M2Z8_9VIBR|nr:non-ribosomal peptide synthetase [Vibrio spartinae]QMV12916.1 Dimodular nonribosomal peptide synthase [Vibrio spartinae]SIO93760.1 Dimodular nonribosomal peptide synthase [Vibrio spartinae]
MECNSLSQFSTVLEKLKDNAERTPDKLALNGDLGSVSYTLLEAQSEQLASQLIRDKGIRAGNIVPLVAGRTNNSLICMLALLKVRAVVYPIEVTNFNADTQKALMNDSELSFSDTLFASDLGITLEQLVLGAETNDLPETGIESGGFLYFTSGSTGKKKPVFVSAENISQRIANTTRDLGFDCYLKTLWCCSVSFDISLFVTLSTLYCGGTIITPRHVYLNEISGYLNTIKQYNVNFINQVPSFIQALCEFSDFEEKVKLKYLFLGGDVLTKDVLMQTLSCFDADVVANIYGPTETTMLATHYVIDQENYHNLNSLPIGKPFSGTVIEILDEDMQPMSYGEVGEIYIRGIGMCRYLNHDNSSFITCDSGTVAYQSGDFGYIDSNGDVVFEGRRDDQVKISGVRLSLSEIENHILKDNHLVGRVRIAKLSGDIKAVLNTDLLVFYILADSAKARQVPVFTNVIPPSVRYRAIRLDNFTYNENGKVAIKEMIATYAHFLSEQKSAVPISHDDPREQLVKTILGIDHFDHSKSFRELGGASLVALKLRAEMKKQFGIEIKIRDLLTSKQSLKELIGAVSDA